MKFAVKTNESTDRNEPQWYTFYDEGDGDPVKFLIAPWTVAAQMLIDDQIKDKQYIESLDIDWDAMPKAGTRKQLLRRALMFDHLLRGWTPNVVGPDGETLEVTLLNKMNLTERPDLFAWFIERGNEGSAGVQKEDAKNSKG